MQRDTGERIRIRYRIQFKGYRIQDTGYRIQDTGYRIQDTREIQERGDCVGKEVTYLGGESARL